jgi:putative transposase
VRPSPPNALSESERQSVLDLLHEPKHADLAVAQVWCRALDDGIYLCSQSTMHRLLGLHGESRERRRQRTHPAKKKPELMATRPNEVWSWDITKLKGPDRGTYFDLYVVLDIFSRYVVAWLVAPAESAELARDFLEDAILVQDIDKDTLTIHADRGSSMRSKPVSQLLIDLGVARSHSRPHVCLFTGYSVYANAERSSRNALQLAA